MREELSIRKAREEDFAAVRGLAEALAAHIEEPPPPLTHERYLAFYVRDDAPMQLFLAQRGDDVVGLIAWVLTHELYSADLCLFVIDVAVSSDARGLIQLVDLRTLLPESLRDLLFAHGTDA